MAINTTTRQTTAFTSGNNFAFAFKVYEEGDVKVIRITTSTGAEEVLTITTHYTVTLNDDQNANPGGTVTLVNSGNPVNLGSGFNVVITSKVTPLQQTEITNQGGFFPEVINDVLDKAAILDQQQQAILDKTIRFPLTQTVGGLEITENAANRAGKVVQFDGSGDLTILGTVDGRDVSADGAKLDTIETNAKDDQTAAEIRTLVESANDSNVFTDADHTKLNGIEAGATADLTASEIKALYEGNSNTNVLSDAQVSKLAGIEAGATGDQSASEIRTLVGSANDSNVFTDNDHSKLDGIETGATADQTSGDIKTLLQSDKLTHLELANDSVRVSQIQDSQITAAKLDPAAVITASEQASATPNDTSFLTSAAADARFFNVSTGDTIKDGDTFPDNDTTIATTAAINDRIIDLVDDVGGFVPIANETSFPTANPDAENGTGTVVSVKAASTDLTPSGTTVTIANGAGTGNTVTITGVPSVIPSGFGFLVETTSTLHTYTFHRLVPKATEVTTVAGKAVEIGRLGTADAVADMAILGTTDVVADMNMLATTDIVADMALLATTDVIADMALLAVTDVISDMNDLATSANITAMANCSNNISSITNASNNLSSVNNFGDTYQVAANDPSTDGGGNSLAEGDLYFNTSANRLKVYDGSSWVNGVEISGSGAVTTGNTFTGDNRYNDGVKAIFGTGSDLEIMHNASSGWSRILNTNGDLYINNIGTNADDLYIQAQDDILIRPQAGENGIKVIGNGGVLLYYDNSTNPKFETTNTGATLNGDLIVSGSFPRIYLTDADNNPDWSIINSNGQLKLFNDTAGASKFLIDSGGDVYVFQNLELVTDNGKIQLGASQDFEIYHNSSNYIDSKTGHLYLRAAGGNIYINPVNNETGIFAVANGKVELYYDNAAKLETTSTGISVAGHASVNGHVTLPDQASGQGKLKLGDGTDFQLYHNGTDSFINNDTGNLLIKSDNLYLQRVNGENYLDAIANGAVTLYHNDIPTLVTDTNGIIVKGPENDYGAIFLYADEGDDNADKWAMFSLASGGFKLQNFTSGSWEDSIKANGNGSVELYYDNSKKLETTSSGVSVTGNIVGTGTSMEVGDFGSDGSAAVKRIRMTQGGEIHFGDTNTSNFIGITEGVVNNFTDQDKIGIYYRNELKLYSNNNNGRWIFNSGGHFIPNTDSSVDIGSNSVRVANGYFDTLYGDGSNLTGINTDLVSDTSPQLGGNLDSNGNAILLGDTADTATGTASNRIRIGASQDLQLFHGPNNSYIRSNQGSFNIEQYANATLDIFSYHDVRLRVNAGETAVDCSHNGSVDLYYDDSLKLATTSLGARVNDNFFGVNVSAPSNTPATKNAFLALGDGDTGVVQDGDGILELWANNQEILQCNTGSVIVSKQLIPDTNDSIDLGIAGYRWRNIYTNDLSLSNEGGKNDVDGTWGSYTIQEGAEDLFLINNRNGKKYKFALMEVS